jgi:hypothetical protein
MYGEVAVGSCSFLCKESTIVGFRNCQEQLQEDKNEAKDVQRQNAIEAGLRYGIGSNWCSIFVVVGGCSIVESTSRTAM